jgi:hypothetical protein
MPTAQILASGTAAARSTTITLAQGESNSLLMRSAGQNSLAIQQQGSDSSWVTIGQLDNQTPSRLVNGPGIFSVYRDVTTVAVAADAAS